jgi:PilZ domain
MRAPRFPLNLAVRYRPLGHAEWRQATTGNISASGVLVHDAEPLQVETRVEFALVLQGTEPAGLGQVAGLGRVVRLIGPDERTEPGFAVAIDDYTFFHTPPRN